MQYLNHSQIDKQRWDNCIKAAENSLIYAETFYLDELAPGWAALVDIDYQWCLPIISRKKWGIAYLYTPPFIQQLGVFGKPGVIIPYENILRHLQEKYSFMECQWNFLTPADRLEKKCNITPGTNYVLPLKDSYLTIAQKYHQDLKSNLAKSKRFSIHYVKDISHETIIQLYKQQYGKRMPHVKDKDYQHFEKVCVKAKSQNRLQCRAVIDQEQTLLSMILLLQDDKRLYNLMNVNTKLGRTKSANHFLLDAILQEFAATSLLLDFEGSDLPGVKEFYENFGAINQPFFSIRYNNLPWPLRLIKG